MKFYLCRQYIRFVVEYETHTVTVHADTLPELMKLLSLWTMPLQTPEGISWEQFCRSSEDTVIVNSKEAA